MMPLDGLLRFPGFLEAQRGRSWPLFQAAGGLQQGGASPPAGESERIYKQSKTKFLSSGNTAEAELGLGHPKVSLHGDL